MLWKGFISHVDKYILLSSPGSPPHRRGMMIQCCTLGNDMGHYWKIYLDSIQENESYSITSMSISTTLDLSWPVRPERRVLVARLVGMVSFYIRLPCPTEEIVLVVVWEVEQHLREQKGQRGQRPSQNTSHMSSGSKYNGIDIRLLVCFLHIDE